MDYGYKLTTSGRALLVACADLEEPLYITRVAIGSGVAGEDTDLADIHELINYVDEGTIAERYHENDRLYLTIQYDNSTAESTFYLAEFMVYATDPETGEETDLLYATLGDYQQPVPAYNSSLPTSIFSFPLVIVVSDEIEVSITASPGVVTHDDLQQLLNEGFIGISRSAITIPADGWAELEDEDAGAYTMYLDMEISTVTERMTPILTIEPDYLEIAKDCSMSTTCKTTDGVLRLYAMSAPDAEMQATLALVGGSGYLSSASGDIPVASATQLGGVMIGDGLSVTTSGVLSIDGETVMTTEDLVDEDEVAKDVADILSEDSE